MSFKKNKLIVAAVLASVMVSLTGCLDKDSKGPGKGFGPGAQIPQVSVMEIKPKDTMLVSILSGRTAPFMVAEVRPQVTGILQKRLFEEGSEVKEGQPLYQIDAATYEAAVASAKANVTNAESVLDQAERTAKRYSQLVKTNAISRQAFDDSEAAVMQAKANLEAAKAQLKAAEINLNYTSIRSPIKGTAGRSLVTPGALLVANQPDNLVTIQTLDPIYVDVTQASTEMLRLKQDISKGLLKTKKGDVPIELILEDGTTFPHIGKLKLSEVSVDQGTGSITLRAEFPNPEKLLLPGMYVRARVPEGIREDAVTVPQKSVQRMNNGDPYVFVLTDDSKVMMRPVKTKRTLGTNWLIDDGLKEGDKIVIEGFQRIRNGVPVKVVPLQSEVSAAANQAKK